MARFDVYRARHEDILLLDLQTSMLDILKSRIVVPLYPLTEMSWQIGKLNPRFTINGTTYVMATQRMASINVEGLGPVIGELSKHAGCNGLCVPRLLSLNLRRRASNRHPPSNSAR